jgi:gluconolactonase
MLAAVLLTLFLSLNLLAPTTRPMSNEGRSAEFEKLLAADAKVEKIADGFQFIEGPAWLDGGLVFSDIPNDRLHFYKNGEVSVWREPSRNANGNVVDHDGHLVTCEHGSRVVSRTKSGERTVIADEWDGKKFNSPNDVQSKSDGTLWFTDPYWGLPAKQREELMEYGGCYVFRLDPDGSVTSVATDFKRPNGLAFTADEKTLYIADDQEKHIRRFTVNDDNTLSGGEIFCTIEPGVPDGIRVDEHGNVWTTAGNGVQVFAPDGTHLGTVEVPESPANCAFGGDDGRTLFMTARTGLYAIRTTVRDARSAQR